jgi:hypothetical protein
MIFSCFETGKPECVHPALESSSCQPVVTWSECPVTLGREIVESIPLDDGESFDKGEQSLHGGVFRIACREINEWTREQRVVSRVFGGE